MVFRDLIFVAAWSDYSIRLDKNGKLLYENFPVFFSMSLFESKKLNSCYTVYVHVLIHTGKG